MLNFVKQVLVVTESGARRRGDKNNFSSNIGHIQKVGFETWDFWWEPRPENRDHLIGATRDLEP